MTRKPIIEIRGLSKRYTIGADAANRWSISRLLRKREEDAGAQGNGADGGSIWAIKDIDLDIHKGERVGIIGRNGAGKSTLLKILSRVIYPTEGEAIIRGRVTPLLGLGTGFNNNATGRENIYINASLHGLSRGEIDDRLDEIIAFAELRQFIDTPIRHYSTGMRSRLAFAIAAHLDPDVLMLDEVLSVGDMAFQHKCLRRMKSLTAGGQTLLFVSHSMGSVTEFCSRCIWIEQGHVQADGPTKEVTAAYLAATTGLKSRVELSSGAPPGGKGINGAVQKSRRSQSGDVEVGDHVTRLVSATVVNRDGERVSILGVDEEFGIQLVMDVMVPDRGVEPNIHIKDEQEQLAFVVAFTADECRDGLNEVGRYNLTCWVPSQLLNTGKYTVNVHLVTPEVPLQRHCKHDDLLSFFVHDVKSGGPSARGRHLAPRFPGAVRPLLKWQMARDAT